MSERTKYGSKDKNLRNPTHFKQPLSFRTGTPLALPNRIGNSLSDSSRQPLYSSNYNNFAYKNIAQSTQSILAPFAVPSPGRFPPHMFQGDRVKMLNHGIVGGPVPNFQRGHHPLHQNVQSDLYPQSYGHHLNSLPLDFRPRIPNPSIAPDAGFMSFQAFGKNAQTIYLKNRVYPRSLGQSKSDRNKISVNLIQSNTAPEKNLFGKNLVDTPADKNIKTKRKRDGEMPKLFLLEKMSQNRSRRKFDAKNLSKLPTKVLIEKRKTIENELALLQRNAGKLIRRSEANSIKDRNSVWNIAINQAKQYQKTFFANINLKQSVLRKMTKDIINFKERKLKEQKKSSLDIERRRKKKSREISRLVKAGYWKKIQKLAEMKNSWREEEQKRNLFKKRLDSFVEKSAALSSKVAEGMAIQENNAADEEVNMILDKVSKEKKEFGRKSVKTPTGNTIATCPVKTPVPPLLRFGSLRDYQRIGLDWLVALHSGKMNGILADEMGLGKTIQTIALLAHLATAEENWGPHLVVVPTSVIVNWEMEFKRWLPGFKVMAYYGSPKERKLKRRGWEEPNSFHVLITSYNLVVADGKALRRKNWGYLVLDEAHHIKNFQSKKWQTMLGFNTEHRLLLTGTPLQNNIMELWAFLHFLMPSVFASRLEFTQWFDSPMSELMKRNHALANSPAVKALHTILRPFMLRRLKKDVAKQLPQKHEVLVKCKLSLRQRRLYEDFMQESSTKDAIKRENFYGMWGILMQLRKVCNHPDLFEGRPILSPFEMGKLEINMPLSLVQALEKTPLPKICSDLVRPNFSFNKSDIIRRKFEKDDLDKLKTDENKIVALYNENSNKIGSLEKQEYEKILDEFVVKNENSSKSDLIWASKTTIKHKKEEKMEKNSKFKAKENTKKCTNQNSIFGENLIRILYFNKRLFESQISPNALKDIIKSPSERSNEMSSTIKNFVCINPPARASSPSPNLETKFRLDETPLNSENNSLNKKFPVKRDLRSRAKRRIAKKLEPFSTQESQGRSDSILKEELDLVTEPFHLALIRASMNFPDKRLIQWDCGKLQKLSQLLEKHKKNGDRCLIFTQMTKVLDILEAFINIYGYRYFRLDGSTRTDRRGYMMERFNSDDSIFLFILTTRSGGYGINLAGANIVIFYDTDWNPAIDMQAQDRAHRIGQTREVTIYRLISSNTVEENMFSVALSKRQVNAAVIGAGKFNSDSLFRRADIWRMFGDQKRAELADETGDNDDGKQMLKMMREAEDVEDTKSLSKAIGEIETAQMTAQEHTEQLESELNDIELYGFNYEKSWLSMTGLISENDNRTTQNEPSIKRQKRKRKHDKSQSSPRKEEEGVEDSEEHGHIRALLQSNFLALDFSAQQRLLNYLAGAFRNNGYQVFETIFNPFDKNMTIYNPFENNLSPSEIFLSYMIQKNGSKKPSLSIDLDFRHSRNKNRDNCNNNEKASSGNSETTTDYNNNSNTDKNDKDENVKNSRNNKNEKNGDNVENGKENLDDITFPQMDFLEKNGFFEDSYDLETTVFESLFPAEYNIDRINDKIEIEPSIRRATERSYFDYHWKTCPALPDISVFDEPKEKPGILNDLNKNPQNNRILSAQQIHRRKNIIQKRVTRKAVKKLNQKRRTKIFAREVIIKIPFGLIRHKYPNGWISLKDKNNYKNPKTRDPSIRKNRNSFFFNGSETKRTDLKPIFNTPIFWTPEEDTKLLKLFDSFGKHSALIVHSLNCENAFFGSIRTQLECQLRLSLIISTNHKNINLVNNNQNENCNNKNENETALKHFEEQNKAFESTFNKLKQNNELPLGPESVAQHLPSALNSAETLKFFKKAFRSAKLHKAVCKGIVKDSLQAIKNKMGSAVHSSHEIILNRNNARLKGVQNLEKRKGSSGVSCIPKRILDSEFATRAPQKPRLGTAADNKEAIRRLWIFARKMSSSPEWLLEEDKEKAQTSINIFITTFKSVRPNKSLEIERLLQSNLSNRDKLKGLARMFISCFSSHS